MAWRGVAWRGVAWRGVAWCGVVWCGVVWCGVVWCTSHPPFAQLSFTLIIALNDVGTTVDLFMFDNTWRKVFVPFGAPCPFCLRLPTPCVCMPLRASTPGAVLFIRGDCVHRGIAWNTTNRIIHVYVVSSVEGFGLTPNPENGDVSTCAFKADKYPDVSTLSNP